MFCNTPSSLLKGTVVMPKRLSEGPTNYRHMSLRLILGLLFSSGIGLIAHRRQSLDKSGVLGAIVCGTSIVGMGGWSWGLSLVYFFVSSSLLSSFRAREKAIAASDKFSKGWRACHALRAMLWLLTITEHTSTSEIRLHRCACDCHC